MIIIQQVNGPNRSQIENGLYLNSSNWSIFANLFLKFSNFFHVNRKFLSNFFWFFGQFFSSFHLLISNKTHFSYGKVWKIQLTLVQTLETPWNGSDTSMRGSCLLGENNFISEIKFTLNFALYTVTHFFSGPPPSSRKRPNERETRWVLCERVLEWLVCVQ